MASYRHFIQKERIMLSFLRRKGFTQKEIARELNKNQSTISRELRRNKNENGNYHADDAIREAEKRKMYANELLKRIENDYCVIVCHETIYQYIYEIKPELKKYLRNKKGKYRRRYGTKIREKQREEAKKKRIDTRPNIIEKRERLGDWEGDTIVGKKGTGSLITNVDRMSGYLLMDYVKRATAPAIREKTIRRFTQLPRKKRKTMTYDNGKEFSDHEFIERMTKMEIYFAYPYHSWERGTNENTNGLVRQFFPKKFSFAETTENQIRRVMQLLNGRPRKRLGYLTPAEVFVKNMHLT